MTDRRRYDPFAPAPRPEAEDHTGPPPASLTGVVQPPANDYAAELPADLDDISKPDLIALAELAGVATYGTKAEIAARIRGL